MFSGFAGRMLEIRGSADGLIDVPQWLAIGLAGLALLGMIRVAFRHPGTEAKA